MDRAAVRRSPMVSCPPTPVQCAAMHIVILAWLYVTFAMALTMGSVTAGLALFLGLGLAPVALWAAIRVRRHRARREREAARAAGGDG